MAKVWARCRWEADDDGEPPQSNARVGKPRLGAAQLYSHIRIRSKKLLFLSPLLLLGTVSYGH